MLNTNSCYFIGELVEVKRLTQGTFEREGQEIPYVSASIILKCVIRGEENLIQLENFTPALKKDGTPNKNYNTIVNINDMLNKRVVVSGASLSGERFWSTKNNQLVPVTKINFNIINLASRNQTEDKAEFKFGGFVYRELAEKNNEEGELQYYTITLAQANYKEDNMFEIQFTVAKDNFTAAQHIREYYEQGATVEIKGEISNLVSVQTITEEVDFGEPTIRTVTRSEKHFYITGGNKPIVGEGEYSAEAIAALVKAYAISGAKIKEDALKSTSKTEAAGTPAEAKGAPSKKAALAGLI